MKRFLLFTITCGALSAFGQVASIKPAQPAITDSISVSYNPSSPLAKLNATEQVFVRVTATLQNGSISKFHKLLTNTQGNLRGTFALPALTASFKTEFYTLNKDDGASELQSLVYRADHVTPVQSAYLDSFFSPKADSLFNLEIVNYPGNYLAYAKYINVASMTNDPETAKRKIGKLLPVLLSAVPQNAAEQAGLLSAKCLAYSKMGDLGTAKPFLIKLLNEFPTLPATAFTFNIYNYEYYKLSGKQVEEDVRKKIKWIFVNHPDAELCQDMNVFEYLWTDTEIPTAAFEKAMQALYREDRVQYYALGRLPGLYISRGEKLDSARYLLERAIGRYQDGSIQHQYRLNTGHYQMYVPLLMFDLAKIDILENKLQQAISQVSAAIQLVSGSNVEGNFLPLMLQLRADAYKRLGNLNLALQDYKNLYLAGRSDMADSMKAIFALCDVKQKDFSDFLSSLKPGGQISASRKILSNFTGRDLHGNQVSLTDLKGKLVVVNVWGTGCGPCIAEMPVLNELVKTYKGNDQVVFIAVTADQRKDLDIFFKKRRFDYNVLSDVKNIQDIFETNALPVHMVIGRNGEIINRSVGAREDIKDYLKGILDANL